MESDTQFTRRAVARHLRRHHPRCPQDAQEVIVERLLCRRWRDASLGKAVGIVTSTYVRHQLTDYDRLLKVPGMTRAEARLVVTNEIREILASWRQVGGPS